MSSIPVSRRILVAGSDPQRVQDRVQAFGDLFAGAPGARHRWRFGISALHGEWVRLEVPAHLAFGAFHTLGSYVALDDPPPREVMLASEGHGDLGYWLVPSPSGLRHVLAGSTASGRAFQVDTVSGTRFDRPDQRVVPLPTGLAQLTRGVHALLQPTHPEHAPDALTVDLELPVFPQHPWSIPPSARLADELGVRFTRPLSGTDVVLGFFRNPLGRREE